MSKVVLDILIDELTLPTILIIEGEEVIVHAVEKDVTISLSGDAMKAIIAEISRINR